MKTFTENILKQVKKIYVQRNARAVIGQNELIIFT